MRKKVNSDLIDWLRDCDSILATPSPFFWSSSPPEDFVMFGEENYNTVGDTCTANFVAHQQAVF